MMLNDNNVDNDDDDHDHVNVHDDDDDNGTACCRTLLLSIKALNKCDVRCRVHAGQRVRVCFVCLALACEFVSVSVRDCIFAAFVHAHARASACCQYSNSPCQPQLLLVFV